MATIFDTHATFADEDGLAWAGSIESELEGVEAEDLGLDELVPAAAEVPDSGRGGA